MNIMNIMYIHAKYTINNGLNKFVSIVRKYLTYLISFEGMNLFLITAEAKVGTYTYIQCSTATVYKRTFPLPRKKCIELYMYIHRKVTSHKYSPLSSPHFFMRN